MYLTKDPPDQLVVVLLTILASTASVLTGLFLRLILCCVLGVDGDRNDGSDEGAGDGADGSGRRGGDVELTDVMTDVTNPTFEGI